ncbi:DNA repair-scaffolding protein isoform X2 [Lepisosteus oculatus]|uniref:DNA repair-scaffolding protein isoform X2 n=1 Tax=Lepisosteus oculatus TaxID=7918 RepID=UPI00371C1885
MSLFAKRKRRSREVRRAVFPDDVKDGVQTLGNESTRPPSSVAKSWERRGDGFRDCPVVEGQKLGSSGKKLRAVRQLVHSSFLAKAQAQPEDPVHIVWSSSDSELSEGESQRPVPRNRSGGARAAVNAYDRYLRAVRSAAAGPLEDELHNIDWDTESDQEYAGRVEEGNVAEISDGDSISEEQSVPTVLKCQDHPSGVAEAEISDYSSDGESVGSQLHAGQAPPPVKPCQAGGKSASAWIRSVQALLQTPQKQEDRSFKTPEDSAKKKNKFIRGGLAERLHQLLSRQRSAVSFWRHHLPSGSETSAACRPGVLVLEVLTAEEQCSVQVALCQPLEPAGPEGASPAPPPAGGAPLRVLFSRDTAARLAPSPGDIVHVSPPWQKLMIDGEKNPVILNTYFSQKVVSVEMGENRPKQRETFLSEKPIPYSLVRVFNLTDESENLTTRDLFCRQVPPASPKPLPSPASQRECDPGVSDSLLDVIEGQWAAGRLGMDVIVVVQRVYWLPFRELATPQLLKDKALSSGPRQRTARLCLLVQDSYGTFSEVQLSPLRSPGRGLRDRDGDRGREWEGRSCVLRGVKVVQRMTRGRSTWLFNLTDSLWPPVVPLKVHGKSQDSQEDTRNLPSPSFCYVLSGWREEGAVEVMQEEAVPGLYLPPVVHTLCEILQRVPDNNRCTFSATVIYKRLQSPDLEQSDFWLFVTDASLQSDVEDGLWCRRTVPVCVTTSCVLDSALVQVLNSDTACTLTFKDAVKECDAILCVERTVLQLEPLPLLGSVDGTVSPGQLPEPVKLDELDLTTKANSLCVVKGVVTAVDESTAYSWPACSWCGNEKLKPSDMEQQTVYCDLCRTTVERPAMRMHLEIFLHCASHSQWTVKIKLLQKTIESLLRSADSDSEGYKVESVLGKELGPLTGYVRIVTKKPAAWIGLEEIRFCGSVTENLC